MGVTKASLLRLAALTLIAGLALVSSQGAKAQLGGLSIRAGFFRPERDVVRSVTDYAAFGGGVDYKIGGFPNLFNGAQWSTSVSVDFHYSERKAGILRYIPVSINQVYTFEGDGKGYAPYVGFCATAATFGGSGGAKQPTVTRFGGGLILGANLTKHIYVEGRYEWFDKHGTVINPEGFRGYVGFRF